MSLNSVEDLAREMAAGLGAAAGKHVVLVGSGSPALFETWCALVRLGALPLVLPPGVHEKDFCALMKSLQPVCLVLENAALLAKVLAMPGRLMPRTLVLEGLVESDDERVLSRTELKEVAGEVLQALGRTPAFGEPSEDTALLLYTSAGATRTPQVHSLTHHEAVQQAIMVADRLRITEEDRVLALGPWCHLPTLLFKVLIPVVQDLQVILAAPGVSLSSAVRQMAPTVVYGPAAIYRDFYKEAMETLEGNPLVRSLARWAVDVGLSQVRQKQQGEAASPWQQAKARVAEAVYYRRCRDLLSDDLRVMVYSDEGLHPLCRQWYQALGLPLVGGYYLAEAGGFLSLESGTSQPGAGLPLPGKRLTLTEAGFLSVGEGKEMTLTDDLGAVEEDGHVRVLGHAPPAAMEDVSALDLHRALQLVQLSPLVKEVHWHVGAIGTPTLLVLPSTLASEMASRLSAREAHALVEEALREELEDSGLPTPLVESLGVMVAWSAPTGPVALTRKPTCRQDSENG